MAELINFQKIHMNGAMIIIDDPATQMQDIGDEKHLFVENYFVIPPAMYTQMKSDGEELLVVREQLMLARASGASEEMRVTLERIEKELAASRVEVATIPGLKGRIASLETLNATLGETTTTLQAEVAETKTQLETVSNSLSLCQKNNAGLRSQLAAKNNEYVVAENGRLAAVTERDAAVSRATTLDDLTTRLQAKIDEQVRTIQNLRNQLASTANNSAVAATLQNRIDQLEQEKVELLAASQPLGDALRALISFMDRPINRAAKVNWAYVRTRVATILNTSRAALNEALLKGIWKDI